MKLIKEVCPKFRGYPRRYLLLAEVTDEEAHILDLCNMKHESDYDEVVDSEQCEAWMVI